MGHARPRGRALLAAWRGSRCSPPGATDEAAVAAAEEIAAEHAAVTNPAAAPWRSLVAPALDRLGRREEALALAREELELARRVGRARARSAGRCGCSARSSSTTMRPRARRGSRRRSRCSTPRPRGWSSPARSPRSGAALRRERRPADAREPLRRALELAVACSATGLAEHVRTELYAAGARPRTDARSGAAALTASERRVADLAAGGETNRDIAQTLYVTPKTVEVHLSNAYRKLGIRSRRELAGALARMTLIERDAEVAALDAAIAEAAAGQRAAAGDRRAGRDRQVRPARRPARPRRRPAARARRARVASSSASSASASCASCSRPTSPTRRAAPAALAGAAAPAASVFGAPERRGEGVASFAALHGLFWLAVQPRRGAAAAAGGRRPALVRPAVAALPRLPRAAARGRCRSSSPRRVRSGEPGTRPDAARRARRTTRRAHASSPAR